MRSERAFTCKAHHISRSIPLQNIINKFKCIAVFQLFLYVLSNLIEKKCIQNHHSPDLCLCTEVNFKIFMYVLNLYKMCSFELHSKLLHLLK